MFTKPLTRRRERQGAGGIQEALLATVEDAPEPLKALARKIPVDTREHLGTAEMRFRLEAASSLFDEAACADERDAKRLRREGERYLEAVSFKAFMVTASILSEGLSEARKSGDDRAQRELGERLGDFAKRNPQPVLERASNGEDITAVIAELLNMQSAAKPRWFRFRNRS